VETASLQSPGKHEKGDSSSNQTYYRRRRAKMNPAQIDAFNAHLAELARERRRRNPERVRALERAKRARRLQRASQSPGVEVELVL